MPRLFVFALLVFGLVSCKQGDSEVVAEKRERTLFDEQRPLNIVDAPPAGWRQIPATRFRAVNYVAGDEEKVEIFLGKTGGDLLTNATRWMGQFGKEPVTDPKTLTELEMMGARAYLLEAKGNYEPGMGQSAVSDQALFGALIPAGDGVLTVKMVGPAAEVEAMRGDFLTYCKSLELSRVNEFPKAGKTGEETTK